MVAVFPPSRRRAIVVLLLAALAALLSFASPAAAHSELLSSDPKAGSVLDTSPTAITLTFNEPVEIGLGAIRLFDGTGTVVPLEGASHPDGKGSVVTVPLPVLQNGSYVVSWQVVSQDSHPASGAFTFQVGSASTLAPNVLEDVTKAQATNSTAGTLLGLTRALVIVGMIAVGGMLAVIALGAVPPSKRRLLVVHAAGLVGGIAGLLAIPLEAAYTGGLGLSAVTDADAWRSVLETRIGVAWLVRALAIYFGGLALSITARHHTRGWWRSATVALLVVLGTASAYGGHGATGRWALMGTASTVVHVVAMAAWIGGLLAILIGTDDLSSEGIRRFSKTALVAATAVVITGTFQALRRLESASALFDTDYGRLLLAKVFAVAVVLGFATASRTAVHGGLRRQPVPASVGAAGDLDRATLRRSVGAEVLFSAAIVVLTASIMGANPNDVTSAKPFSTTVVSEDYLASITVDPAAVGTDQIHIYLSSPGGSLSKPDTVTVSIVDQAKALAPIGITVVPVGANHWQAVDATFPYPATWTLTIRAIYNTFDEIVFTTDVKVR